MTSTFRYATAPDGSFIKETVEWVEAPDDPRSNDQGLLWVGISNPLADVSVLFEDGYPVSPEAYSTILELPLRPYYTQITQQQYDAAHPPPPMMSHEDMIAGWGDDDDDDDDDDKPKKPKKEDD